MIHRFFIFIWVWCFSLYAITTDFDDVVVGTSPISMFEAIYRSCLGHKVLVVEQAQECGGAWKSITICGIEHVDMGCHEFGGNKKVGKFLEEYAGCKIFPNALYPSHGCYELTHHLQLLMQKVGTILMLGSRVESVYVDTARHLVQVKVNGRRLTTKKMVVTHCSEISFENSLSTSPVVRVKYPHIYLLVEDSTPVRFSYKHLSVQGVARAMNVTPFVGLEGSGMQLLAFQVYSDKYLQSADLCLNELKQMGLIDEKARILRQENYTYEQGSFNQAALYQIGPEAAAMFDVLNTGHIANIGIYSEKWKKAMRPWKEVME